MERSSRASSEIKASILLRAESNLFIVIKREEEKNKVIWDPQDE